MKWSFEDIGFKVSNMGEYRGSLKINMINDDIDSESIQLSKKVVLLNQISSIIAFIPPLFAVVIGIELTDFALVLLCQTIVILMLSIYKHSIERKLRELEMGILMYVMANAVSYLLVSISIPIAVFLVDYFYRLSLVFRLISLNTLFVLGFLFLLSSIPASRIIRISEPLDDNFLWVQASKLSSKLGTGGFEIYVIKKDKFRFANAAQIGARKFFVFVSAYLLENLTPEENVSVIAHELSHAKKRHVLKTVTFVWILGSISGNLILMPVNTGITPIFSYVLPLLGFIVIALSGLLLVPAIRRRFEIEADVLASEIYDGETLISALQKIGELNMEENAAPNHWRMGHPATVERIRKIREHAGKSGIRP